MEPKMAIVQLDGQELTRLIHVSIKKSKHEAKHGNHLESQHYLNLADKLADAKEELHQKRFEVDEQ